MYKSTNNKTFIPKINPMRFNFAMATRPIVSVAQDASAEDLAAIEKMEAHAAQNAAQNAAQDASAEDLAEIEKMEAHAAAMAAQDASAEDLAAIEKMETQAMIHVASKHDASQRPLPSAQATLDRARALLISSQVTLDCARAIPASTQATLDRAQATLDRAQAIPAYCQMVPVAEYHSGPLRRPEPARVSADSEEKIRELRLVYLANHRPQQQFQPMRVMRFEVGEASIAYTKAESRHTELRQELRELKMVETKLPPSVKAQWTLLCREKEREVNAAAQEENYQHQLLNKIRGL